VQRFGGQDLFDVTADSFEWEEPEEPHVEVEPPRPDVRRPPPRTFRRDLARLRQAVSDRPARALAPIAMVLVLGALAFAVKTMFFGGDGTRVSGDRNASVSLQPKPSPGIELPATLEPGAEGTEVLDLQEGLAALGYDVGGADGVYGNATANAVAAFQSAEGLPVDGVLGSSTREALRTVVTTRLREEAAPIRDGFDAAVQGGAMTEADASELRARLDGMIADAAKIPPAHALYLPVVLRDAATQSTELTRPRALALLGEIGANLSYLRRHPIPAERTDTHDADGITYRFFPDHGFQFHPLAAFARLNVLTSKGRRSEVERLATALLDRGAPVGNALTWEYYFSVNGGPTRWTSALAQAAAADALARAGQLLDDPAISQSAQRAYRAIPAELSRPLGGGIWVREYGFSDIAILNAQLQSIVSLGRYAAITHDRVAQDFVGRLLTAALTLLPQFDTGCWSRYSLDGSPASLDYHTYHVHLLGKLAESTGNSIWATTESRWRGYLDGAGCPP
jgi:D-glucuronyl C5-epimerase-like protein/putative peptidoglycan binding protein